MLEESDGQLPWVCSVAEHCQPGVQRYLEGNLNKSFLNDC